MSFPKMGKFRRDQASIASRSSDAPLHSGFAVEIGAALRRELGSTHAAIKTAAAWTGANQRTTKNWLSGRYGPSGEHLVGLAHNSNEVLVTFLRMAGREDIIAATALSDAEENLVALLNIIRTLRDSSSR